MTKPNYEVIQCALGQENLQSALNDIADRDGEIVSVVPDYGSGLFGTTLGSTQGFLIVARRID